LTVPGNNGAASKPLLQVLDLMLFLQNRLTHGFYLSVCFNASTAARSSSWWCGKRGPIQNHPAGSCGVFIAAVYAELRPLAREAGPLHYLVETPAKKQQARAGLATRLIGGCSQRLESDKPGTTVSVSLPASAIISKN